MSKKSEINFLSLVPIRNVADFSEGQGIITLHVPRFKNNVINRLFTFGKKSPYVNVRLDETGSEIWRLIDGKRTVEEICGFLLTFMTEKNKPSDQIEERVTQFLSGMYRNSLVVTKS